MTEIATFVTWAILTLWALGAVIGWAREHQRLVEARGQLSRLAAYSQEVHRYLAAAPEACLAPLYYVLDRMNMSPDSPSSGRKALSISELQRLCTSKASGPHLILRPEQLDELVTAWESRAEADGSSQETLGSLLSTVIHEAWNGRSVHIEMESFQRIVDGEWVSDAPRCKRIYTETGHVFFGQPHDIKDGCANQMGEKQAINTHELHISPSVEERCEEVVRRVLAEKPGVTSESVAAAMGARDRRGSEEQGLPGWVIYSKPTDREGEAVDVFCTDGRVLPVGEAQNPLVICNRDTAAAFIALLSMMLRHKTWSLHWWNAK